MTKQNNQSEVKEIWVPCQFINEDGTLEEYPNYEVSNLGRVRSLNYNHAGKIKVLRPVSVRCPNGTYFRVSLCRDKKHYQRSFHRLVLSSFNQKGYFKGAIVDHIDSNPSNNNLKNLHWVTYQENTSTSHYKSLQINHPAKSKRVRVTFLGDGHIEIFPSTYEVERVFKLPKNTVSTYINKHCNHYKKLNLLFEYI